MLLWNLIPMPSLRFSIGLFPEVSFAERMRRSASRRLDQGSARDRQSPAVGRAPDAKYVEPEWQGQWRTLKHL